MLKVHILADDSVRTRGLLAEHGLSLLIEKDDKSILFDTGQTNVFCHNAKLMGIDLERVDHIVLSHGHYDHCGGLIHFPNKNKVPKIYAHTDLFLKKFASTDQNEPSREVGVPWDKDKYNWLSKNLNYNKNPKFIDDNIMISGEIPCLTDFEDLPNDFYLEKDDKLVHDLLVDEQMLIIEDDGELVVFIGCSHPGVINCLKYAKKLFNNKRIKLLVAGMHLENISPIRLQLTIQHMLDMDIQKVVPLHCTGFNAINEIKRFLGDRCLIRITGDTIEV